MSFIVWYVGSSRMRPEGGWFCVEIAAAISSDHGIEFLSLFFKALKESSPTTSSDAYSPYWELQESCWFVKFDWVVVENVGVERCHFERKTVDRSQPYWQSTLQTPEQPVEYRRPIERQTQLPTSYMILVFYGCVVLFWVLECSWFLEKVFSM